MRVKVAGIIPTSMTNGPGLRYTIFFQGCSHRCKGCHNPETWNPVLGTSRDIEEIKQDILRHKPIIQGITLSGGEPFLQPLEAQALAQFAHSIGLDVWCYTGYEYKSLIKKDGNLLRDYRHDLLNHLDVLVDGKFMDSLKDDTLKWRGSSNQHVIKLEAGRFVEFLSE